jgi:DNA mismatch repair ATPase MutL
MPSIDIIKPARPVTCIPPPSGTQTSFAFITRHFLRTATIIGQVDCKLIACYTPANGDEDAQIFVIDQHAADERVRFEILLKEILLGFINDNMDTHNPAIGLDVELLCRHQTVIRDPSCASLLARWGIRLKPKSIYPPNEMLHSVVSVPSLLKTRLADPKSDTLTCILREFLEDWEQRASSSCNVPAANFDQSRAKALMPKSMRGLIESTACRSEYQLGGF